MANVSKLKIGDTSYDVTDTTAQTNIGTLSNLVTTEKTNLVSAINEVAWETVGSVSSVSNSGSTINIKWSDISDYKEMEVRYYVHSYVNITTYNYSSSSGVTLYGSITQPNSTTKYGFILNWDTLQSTTATLTYYINGTASALNTTCTIRIKR